jgi:biotin carboxyl carrier protein
MKYLVTTNNQTYTVDVTGDGDVLLDGQLVSIDFSSMGEGGLCSLLVNNESFEALVEQRGDCWQVLLLGTLYDVQVIDERAERLRSSASTLIADLDEIPIRAPMPGLVVAVPVEQGQEVAKGDNLVILESMKMENELKAPREGRVERVNVRAGDGVDRDQVLVVLV